jgi:site-specific DNA-methyltransferase (adenine-specific)
MIDGEPYVKTRSKTPSSNYRAGLKATCTVNEDGKRYPWDVIEFTTERGLHPTQKPVALLEYLIKTYTDSGDLVLDNCMGSGSTGVACVNTGRDFIGMELDKEYFKIAAKRICEAQEVAMIG